MKLKSTLGKVLKKLVEFSTKRGGVRIGRFSTKIAQNTGNGIKCILRQTYFFQFLFFWEEGEMGK